ncbi:trypsin-like peptidase domain-containing protein [Acidisphaera sp. S103]|uniref:trypsin-like peptidase domain-containing protein n=1 Tax=Acidisphaera sp. S103 TaxID=1747223 RepID=UPI00131CAC7C|nr:trypsin-like peptidase domain-containing protein [Acidisphaera sp. S103]
MRGVIGLCSALGVFLLFALAIPGQRSAWAEPPSDQIAMVVAKVKPAVVTVFSVRLLPKERQKLIGDAPVAASSENSTVINGSGFIIDPSGYIATNKHVIEDSISVSVVTADGIRYKAAIVGVTSKADIALLKIDAGKPLPAVAFGDSDKMQVGDTVIAIGSPFGFDQSVTAGIVSGVNRNIMESPFDDYIQTDATINHGNSGGPLFNVSGKVIGMNSVLFGPGDYSGSIGIGFAIPSDELNFVYSRLIANGKVNAGMLPIRAQQVTWMLAQAIGAPGVNGALVDSVDADRNDMMKGQIKPGDVILSFNGQTVSDPRDLARKVAQEPSGTDAALEIFHDGKRSVVHVPILAWPEGVPPVLRGTAPRMLGLDLVSGPHGGVMVAAVDPAGSAASSGIKKGDIILRVQAQSVSSPDQALRALQAAIPGTHDYVAVLLERNNEPLWLPIPLSGKE